MLVLSRKENESIRIGPDITITVVSLDSNRVRIGIEAPRDIPVFRSELLIRTDPAATPQNAQQESDGPAQVAVTPSV